MKDIRNDVHHEGTDESAACTLTDNEKLRLDEEQCHLLQEENDFLRAQLTEASYLMSWA